MDLHKIEFNSELSEFTVLLRHSIFEADTEKVNKIIENYRIDKMKAYGITQKRILISI